MSRAELADAVNAALDRLYPGRDLSAHYVDSRWVGKLERGEHRWPSEERRTALRHVLGAATDTELDLYSPRRTDSLNAPDTDTDTELGSHIVRRSADVEPLHTVDAIQNELVISRASKSTRVQAHSTVSPRRPDVGGDDGGTTEDIGVPSEALRRLLHSGAMGALRDATALVAATDKIRHILNDVLDDESALGTRVQRLEAAVDDHARDALTVAPFEMISRIALDFLDALHLIRRGPATSALRQLRVVLAKLAALTADEMNVVGHIHAARAWYATATAAADKTEFPELRADVRVLAAMLPLYHGDPAASIQLAQRARQLVEGRNCLASALAPMFEALGWAQLGDHHRDRARAALSDAKRAHDATTEDARAESVFGFSPRRRLFYEGRLLTRLADYPAAWTAHRQALELYPHDVVGDRTIIKLDRAAALITSNQPDSGADLILATLGGLPCEHRAPIFTATASQIVRTAPQKVRTLPAMRACVDLLAELSREAIGPSGVR